MPITFGDSGTNRTVTSVTYGDAGTNRAIREIWYGDSGTNRLVFASVNLLGLDPTDAVATPATATAIYSLTSTGFEQASDHSDSQWLTAGTASDYEARVTITAGTLSSGTDGVWLGLGTTRTWTKTRSAVGISTCTVTVEIRIAATGAVVATQTVVFTAEVI